MGLSDRPGVIVAVKTRREIDLTGRPLVHEPPPYQWDAALGRLMASSPLTIRIDLDNNG
jgi:hypothetical protein